MTAAELVTPRCPAWCELDEHHPWEEVRELRRQHLQRIELPTAHENATVEIFESSEVGAQDYDPTIFVTGDDLTASQAREVAAELVRMADLLDAEEQR